MTPLAMRGCHTRGSIPARLARQAACAAIVALAACHLPDRARAPDLHPEDDPDGAPRRYRLSATATRLLGAKVESPLWHDYQRLRRRVCAGAEPCTDTYATEEVKGLATGRVDVLPAARFAAHPETVAVLLVPANTSFPELALQTGSRAEEQYITLERRASRTASGPVWTAFVNRAGAPPQPLRVTRIDGRGDSIPGVVQWDYDEAGHRQLLGVKCGDGWCEIGRSPPNPSVPPCAGQVGPDALPCRAKGWYDEQRLAVVAGSGGPHVGGTHGVIEPVAGLGDMMLGDFAGDWKKVATLHVAGASYLKGGHVLQRGGAYTLSLRTLPGSGSPPGFRARLEGPGLQGSNALELPVDRADHPTLHVPGTARWRWLETDEGVWVRCASGCCRVSIQ